MKKKQKKKTLKNDLITSTIIYFNLFNLFSTLNSENKFKFNT